MKNIRISYLIVLLAFLFSCQEEEVLYSNKAEFASIQIQKFDYGSLSGRGQIYQGVYSENKDTVYFDVTYYPDQEAPTFTDWQISAALPSGAKLIPSVTGVKDLTEPVDVSIVAPDGKTTAECALVLKIYQVPFAELERGFGRYEKLFELTKDELGGWTSGKQRACAVVGDELIVNALDGPLLVYNKLTGEKIEKTIPMPEGESFYEIFADEDGVLLATTFVSFSASTTPTLKIYRWINGLAEAPEIYYELPTSKIPATGNHGIGLKASIWGSTSGDAQIMLDIDGRGSADDRAVRISVSGGVPSEEIEVFNTGIGTVWSGKAVAMSKTGRTPYVAAMLGFPPKIAYSGKAGTTPFVTDPANSNFFNKIIGNATYFEFNHSKYLALTTASWPGNFRLLIFCLDDPALIGAGKADAEKYAKLNPLVEDAVFLSAGDAGDIAVQVQDDGKTALVYVLGMNTGVFAYELTNIGTSSK
ncbi:hypothetical protein SAMN05444274_10550 [Mariniphaga anaerophila]|uniref:DUF5018 domain-containing protein n=1 Tax=Mariniphaga anaerophila TaxID=1484053 RepID=A0A1M5B9P5_9BACT|nr:hypothetical protein [Mariniphaga anaerophila]SHF39281.1 hypothetical protein SAMN05444274_10550 [Mariniphaga anaerophila]